MTTTNLIGDITIRTTRFQGVLLTEVCPSSFEQIRELRGMGLTNIVQHGKQRFFLPQDAPLSCLERILVLYPPESTSINFLPEMETTRTVLTKEEPVILPGWLIEPDSQEEAALGAISDRFPDLGSAPIVNKLFTM